MLHSFLIVLKSIILILPLTKKHFNFKHIRSINLLQKMISKKITLIALALCFLQFACAQQHKNNETWLEGFKAAEKTTVVLNNEKGFLPIKNLEERNIASIDFGFTYHTIFDSILNKYSKVDHFDGLNYLPNNQINSLKDDLKFKNTIIISVADTAELNKQVIDFIIDLQKEKSVVLMLFGAGNNLSKLDDFKATIILSTINSAESASFAAQLIFGGTATTARLIKTYSTKYITGLGFDIAAGRFKFTVPEEVGINANDLNEIDNIANLAIREKATPGAVVLVAKNGKVIFNKAYGYHTTENIEPEKVSDIFDLASITKISATTMAAMRLYENKTLNLDTVISTYISRTKNTDKQNIKVKEVMLHQAGFIPFIPFYNSIKPADFSRDSTESFSVKVADSFYMSKSYFKDVMWQQMLKSHVKTRGKYVYSDLSMYFMKEIVETITSKPLAEYVKNEFYKPLGMYTTDFNPRNRFSKSQIIPTENDTYFRKTLLWGYVHDQGAAMVGGVSGHAGLFSNASDLAILYQMLLNGGTYGGKQYFTPQTISLFTSKQSPVSRRGLGFDRWDPDTQKEYPSKYASSQTFGHTGYTGTCVWVDPAENLIYIFLSNRVHPKVTDKLADLKIRGRIQDAIYNAIKKSK